MVTDREISTMMATFASMGVEMPRFGPKHESERHEVPEHLQEQIKAKADTKRARKNAKRLEEFSKA